MSPAIFHFQITNNTCNNRQNTSLAIRKKSNVIFYSIVIIFTMVFVSHTGFSQTRSLSYQVLRNGNKVGTLKFSETVSGNLDQLKLESDVKTRFIVTFTAHAQEEAVYYGGILFRSSIYRKLNGNEKINKQHQVMNSAYVIHTGNNSVTTNTYPITYNMLRLYSREPENIVQVYSDNFQTHIAIQKIESHVYKISFPDGNYNIYHYQNGVPRLIEIHHNLYTANIVLID